MSTFLNVSATQVLRALGWTFAHSLWQGLVVFAIVYLVLRFSSIQKPLYRYRWAVAGQLSMLFFVLLTYFYEITNLSAKSGGEDMFLNHALEGSYFTQLTNWYEAHMHFLVALWLMGVCFLLVRLLLGLLYIKQLRKPTNQRPFPSEWFQVAKDLVAQLNISTPITFALSEKIKTPLAIGFWRPMVLLPIALVSNLSIEELTLILRHELAHIRRFDYAVNVILVLVEALLYYHPVTWWLGRHVRTEREICCDAQVVFCSSKIHVMAYAQLLLRLQTWQMASNENAFVMAFSASPKGLLLTRVESLFKQPQEKSYIMEKTMASLLVFILAISWVLNSTSAKLPNLLPSTLSLFTAKVDTQPATRVRKMEYVFTTETVENGQTQKYELKAEGEKITSLTHNGRLVPRTEYSKHRNNLDGLMAEDGSLILPEEPPAPLAPPVPPTPPSTPTPPDAPTRVEKRVYLNGENMPPPPPPTPANIGGQMAPPLPPLPPLPPIETGLTRKEQKRLKKARAEGKEPIVETRTIILEKPEALPSDRNK